MKTKVPKKLRKKLAPLLPTTKQWLVHAAQTGLESALDELVVHHVRVIARVAGRYTPKRAKEGEQEIWLARALKVFERTVLEAPSTGTYPDLDMLFSHNMIKEYGVGGYTDTSLVHEALAAHLLSCPLPLDPHCSDDERPLLDTVVQHTFPSAIEALSRLDHGDFIQKALELKQLKKKERLVLELLYLDELSVKEVADQLNLHPEKVKQLEARARRVIRGEMRDPRE